MHLTFTLADIGEAAHNFWRVANTNVFAFHGSMGAGKTTFIHALCKAKGVHSRVNSPTFSIINEYGYDGGTIFHLDLYRIQDVQEALNAGVEECLHSGEICMIEWPEKALELLPEQTLHSRIVVLEDQSRQLFVDHK